MPTKPALLARAAELQKRHPYFTKRDIQILMDIEAEDAARTCAGQSSPLPTCPHAG